MDVAYCARTGEIGFGRSLPKGMLAIAYGTEARLKAAVYANAHPGPDGETPIVPGVPYAASDKAALAAARRFAKKLSAALNQ